MQQAMHGVKKGQLSAFIGMCNKNVRKRLEVGWRWCGMGYDNVPHDQLDAVYTFIGIQSFLLILCCWWPGTLRLPLVQRQVGVETSCPPPRLCNTQWFKSVLYVSVPLVFGYGLGRLPGFWEWAAEVVSDDAARCGGAADEAHCWHDILALWTRLPSRANRVCAVPSSGKMCASAYRRNRSATCQYTGQPAMLNDALW
jgi:hypothetical protein